MKTRKIIALCATFTILLGTGCSDEGGQDILECEPDETPITAEEESELGFSADDVLAAVMTTGETSLNWEAGEQTDLYWEFVEADDAIRYVLEINSQDGTSEACGKEYLAIGGTLEIETDDGELDEAIDIDLIADSATSVEFSSSIEFDNLAGNLEVEGTSSDDLLQFEGQITAAGSEGSIYADRYEESDDKATDHAFEPIAGWSSASE